MLAPESLNPAPPGLLCVDTVAVVAGDIRLAAVMWSTRTPGWTNPNPQSSFEVVHETALSCAQFPQLIASKTLHRRMRDEEDDRAVGTSGARRVAIDFSICPGVLNP